MSEVMKTIKSGAEDSDRKLIYIPIIHTESDMGTLSQSVRLATLRRVGLADWRRKVNLIDQLWTEIEKVITNLSLSYGKVRLYQDGLPVCGREVEIVRDVASTGSRNYHLLLYLMEKGAQIMGTESPELLVEEYEVTKQLLAAGTKSKTEGVFGEGLRRPLMDSLLKRRDQYIAERINTTLGSGETGILFLGRLHSLGNRLDKDIRIAYPIHKPFPG